MTAYFKMRCTNFSIIENNTKIFIAHSSSLVVDTKPLLIVSVVVPHFFLGN